MKTGKIPHLTAAALLALVACQPSSGRGHHNGDYIQNYQNALKQLGRIYHDFGYPYTLYCGCRLLFKGNKPKIIDAESCGFRPRKNPQKGMKVEWEHMMPASRFGQRLSCWKAGGRKNCGKNPGYRYIEGDMHNLAPAVGEINIDRGNFGYAPLKTAPYQYGRCRMVVDFRRQLASPPPAARGPVARAYLYMSSRYSIKLEPAEEKLYNFWNSNYPPAAWECRRNVLISRIQGNDNKFITAACKKRK